MNLAQVNFYAFQRKPEDTVPPTDAYTEYLHKPNKNMNEHDYFFKAKAELQKHHHEKVTKVTPLLMLERLFRQSVQL